MQEKELNEQYKDMLLKRKYVTTKELGAILGITKQRVNQLKNKYNIEPMRIHGADIYSIEEAKIMINKRKEFYANYVPLSSFSQILPDKCEKLKKCIALGLLKTKINEMFCYSNAVYVNKEEVDEKIKELYQKDISNLITKTQAKAILGVTAKELNELITKHSLYSIYSGYQMFVKKSEILELRDKQQKLVK